MDFHSDSLNEIVGLCEFLIEDIIY
jgi:hypothetical protein